MFSYQINSIPHETLLAFLKKYDHDSSTPLSDRVNIEDYASKLKKQAISFEAWHGDTLAGILLAYINNDDKQEGFITYLRVIPEFRGNGIATNLMDQMILECERKGYQSVTLEVAKDNKNAIALYEKYDFSTFKENSLSFFMRKKLDVYLLS